MRRGLIVRALLTATAASLWLPATAPAQQATVAGPMHRAASGFYEYSGTQWGLQGGNFSLQVGGPVAPPFGPAAARGAGLSGGPGLSGGVGVVGPRGSGYFHGAIGAGSSASLSSQVASVTGVPGSYGYVADTSISPFVVGAIPVVGGYGSGFTGNFYPGAGGFPAAGSLLPVAPGGTAVQLPTFSMFSGGSTVSVPDRGGVFQGGVKRGRQGADAGVGNRAIGAERQAGGMQVRAQIHDLPAMDEAILAGGRGESRPADPSVAALAEARQSTAGQPAASVADARRARQQELAAEEAEAAECLKKAAAAEAEGKRAVARIWYQMAARRGAEPHRSRALERLAALDGK